MISQILVYNLEGGGGIGRICFQGWETYKPPSAKTQQQIIFCLRGISTGVMAGIGMIQIITSDVIFNAAVEYQSGLYEMQWPAMVGSQKRATGMQFKNALRITQVP